MSSINEKSLAILLNYILRTDLETMNGNEYHIVKCINQHIGKEYFPKQKIWQLKQISLKLSIKMLKKRRDVVNVVICHLAYHSFWGARHGMNSVGDRLTTRIYHQVY